MVDVKKKYCRDKWNTFVMLTWGIFNKLLHKKNIFYFLVIFVNVSLHWDIFCLWGFFSIWSIYLLSFQSS